MYRAMESERPDALSRSYARRLAGETGEKILSAMPQGRRWAWPMITRTAVMDEIIMRLVTEQGADTSSTSPPVSTPAYRLNSPPSCGGSTWISKGILSYKEAALRGGSGELQNRVRQSRPARPGNAPRAVPTRRRQCPTRARDLGGAAASTSRRKIDGACHRPRGAAGVSLVAHRLGSPQLLEWLRAHVGQPTTIGKRADDLRSGGRFRVLCACGWREAEYHPMLDAAVRLHRAPRMAWLWKVLALLARRNGASSSSDSQESYCWSIRSGGLELHRTPA